VTRLLLDRTPGDRVVTRYKPLQEVSGSDIEPATQRETEILAATRRTEVA
jgi:hypothetical protein